MPDAELEAVVGPIAMREYEAAEEWAKPKIREFALSLPAMSDDRLREVSASEIHGSALAISFRGNWEHAHFRCTACYDVSLARHLAAGHGRRCGGSIYDQAHAQVMREQGHTPSTSGRCDCEGMKAGA